MSSPILSGSRQTVDDERLPFPHAGDLSGIDYSSSSASPEPGGGGTPDVSFTYDRLGRATTITDGVGPRTFTYSGLDLVAETVPLPDGSTRVITRRFDVAGRLTGLQLSDGPQIWYGYEEMPYGEDKNRVNSVWIMGLGAGVDYYALYAYLADRNRLSRTDFYRGGAENLLQVTRGYEPRRDLLTNVTTVAMPDTAPTLLSQFDYVLDGLGRRVERVDLLALTNLFGYNPRSEIISAALGENMFGYSYDSIGNRLWATANLESNDYTANNLNQYFLITNQLSQIGNDLGYDADGNLTNDSVFAYSWDGENRLIDASNESMVASYAYDYMSRRFRKVVNGATTNLFVYDGWNLISEICNTESQINTNFYVWGLDLSGTIQDAGGVGGLLCVVRNGTPYFPCYDGNGNITDYVDTNGTVVAHREYDAYGNTLVATGPMVNDFNFWFSTKYLDAETGLYYYGYRYYDPVTGRWLSRDPIGEESFFLLYKRSMNNKDARLKELSKEPPYLFVRNNPLVFIDGDGASWWSAAGIIILGGIAINEACCWAHVFDKYTEAEALAERLSGERHMDAGSRADMLTHCLGGCYITKRPGPCLSASRAQRIPDYYDTGATPESLMDKKNNKAGFSCAGSTLLCESACIRALRNGQLFTLNANVPPEVVNYTP